MKACECRKVWLDDNAIDEILFLGTRDTREEEKIIQPVRNSECYCMSFSIVWLNCSLSILLC